MPCRGKNEGGETKKTKPLVSRLRMPGTGDKETHRRSKPSYLSYKMAFPALLPPRIRPSEISNPCASRGLGS